jgi:hypothetical protein
MNALAQNYFAEPWYQLEGPTIEEMKKEIKEKLMDTGPYSKIWKKRVPYLYLKAINDVIEELTTWPLISWKGWWGVKDYHHFKIFEKSENKYKEYMKIRANKQLKRLLEPYVIHILYKYPDGLRIKKVKDRFNQRINKYINKID